MILKLMIMCCLYTPELKLTTCSLCSIHDPYSTLETPVYGEVPPFFLQNFDMSCRRFLVNRNGSNFAHMLLRTIRSYDANPSKNFFRMIRLPNKESFMASVALDS